MTVSSTAILLSGRIFRAAVMPAALFSLPTLAWAGDGTAGSVVTLPTVSVQGNGAADSSVDAQGYVAHQDTSATKTATPLLATPGSVYVVTREEMDQRNTQTVRALLRYLPGVQYSDDTNNRLDSIQARGFTVDQYLDGLRLQGGTWAVPKIEPFFLDNAQFLLGPSSVLYGQSPPGGLLDMQSKLPTDTPRHEVMMQGGTNTYLRGGVDVSGKLNDSGTLLGRFTGTAYTNNTQVSHQKEQRIAIAPSITWRPDTDTSLTLQGGYLYDPFAGFWNQLPLQGTVLPSPFGKIPRNFYVGDTQDEHFTREQEWIGYQFSHRFNDRWSFKQNLRFLHITTDYREIQGSSLEADQHTLDRQAYQSREYLDTLALDNRLTGHFSTGPLTHTFLAGVDYQYNHWRNFTRYGAAPSLDLLAPNYTQAALANFLPPPVFQNSVQTQNQIGIYAQDQIQLGGFHLLLAGRQDWYENDTLNYLTGIDSDTSARHFSGHIGVNYVFENGIAPYASYSTSFQPTTGTTRTGQAFVPTTGEQYEVGIKYQPRHLNALFTAAIYNIDQNNVSTTDPVNPIFTVQTGKVRSRGLELSAVTSPLPGLNIRGAYTHVDTEITSTTVAGTLGKQLANTPNDLASIWTAYTIQKGKLRGLTLGGGVRYVSSAFATVANTISIPSYVTVDSLISYDLGSLSPHAAGAVLSLNGTNIFDKRYESICGALGCYYGLGRTLIAGLNYRW